MLLKGTINVAKRDDWDVAGSSGQLNVNMQAHLSVWVLMPNCSIVATTRAP